MLYEVITCSSELTYRVFEELLSQEMRRVAIYGAIGDFSVITSYSIHYTKLYEVLLQSLQMGQVEDFNQDIEFGKVFHRSAGIEFHDIGIIGTDGPTDVGQQIPAVFRTDQQPRPVGTVGRTSRLPRKQMEYA